jgi:hypothetical protein
MELTMAVDTGLVGLFVTQYKTLLNLRLQQKTSFLRAKCEEGYHAGAKMASPLNLVDAMQMKTPEGRFAPKKNTPANYTRRWVMPIDKEGDQFVDNFDMLKTPIDPKNKLVERAAAAVARSFDDEIIRAATADSTIGADAGSLSTEAFDTSTFRIADDFGASAAVGLTVAKLNEARRILEHYHNVEELDANMGTLVIGSSQHADLRNQALVTSSEFSKNGGILVDGKVTRFMGFDIVVSERLPITTTNTRGCLCFVKSGMYLGVWQDIKTQVSQRFDLSSNPWDISTVVSYGATRTELGKVIQILAHDTIGADITP